MDETEAMKLCLFGKNLMPNAPRNISAYPFKGADPLIIDKTPNLYIVGNTEKFSQQIISSQNSGSVKLISIPKFSETGTVYLLDLDDYSIEEWKICQN